jgi:hypothetical protein
VITGITEIAHITTKQDMSRWTRAHADAPGITWSVFPGPGGTMIIVEHAEDRCSVNGGPGAAEQSAEVRPAVGPAGNAAVRRASA